MNAADRTFGWLLVLGSLFHIIGAVGQYSGQPVTLVWALSAALAGLLLAALNLLRVGRPRDRMLAWISFCGCLGWLALVIAFGVVLARGLDFPVLAIAAITVVLAIFSFRSAVGIHSAP